MDVFKAPDFYLKTAIYKFFFTFLPARYQNALSL